MLEERGRGETWREKRDRIERAIDDSVTVEELRRSIEDLQDQLDQLGREVRQLVWIVASRMYDG